MDTKSEESLIKRLRSGDVRAFNRIYAEYHNALYRNIFKITKNKTSAEDILQEVFIALWEHRSSIQKQKSLSGWLFVISFNKSVNYMKKELTRLKKKKNMPLHAQEKTDARGQKVQYEERLILLEDAISTLSPQKQKTFILCKLEGKTYKEAAQTLNISKYTVKEYLTSSMSIIKNYIKEHLQYVDFIVIISFLYFTASI